MIKWELGTVNSSFLLVCPPDRQNYRKPSFKDIVFWSFQALGAEKTFEVSARR